VKRIDKKHGFIETADGAWKEQKLSKIDGKIQNETAWTQKGKKYLKRIKHRKERQWNLSDENTNE